MVKHILMFLIFLTPLRKGGVGLLWPMISVDDADNGPRNQKQSDANQDGKIGWCGVGIFPLQTEVEGGGETGQDFDIGFLPDIFCGARNRQGVDAWTDVQKNIGSIFV